MPVGAIIGIVNVDGSVTSIDVREDGQLDLAGKILLGYYKTTRQVDELLMLGNLQWLPDSPKSAVDHGLMVKGDPVLWDSVGSLLRHSPYQFAYVFNPMVKQWFFSSCDAMSHNPLPRLSRKHTGY